MHAIVREAVYDPVRLARGRKELEEFQELHARQAGYRGTVVVDLGAGRWLTVNLWDSEEQAAAALPKMGPAVKRLLEPMLASPSKLIGTGPVVMTDLVK